MASPGDGTQANQVVRTVGRDEGRTVHLSVRADPSLEADAPKELAVNLFVPRPDGTNVDVARIDTVHDGVHFDRLYLPEGRLLRRGYDVDVVDYREAQRILVENWRDHVEAYEGTHGLPESDDRE